MMWSDWADWYSIHGKPTEDQLRILYCQDVEYFIARIRAASDIRVVDKAAVRVFGHDFLTRHVLEVRTSDVWTVIEPGDLPAA